jgi:hypothetical protein
MEFSSYADAVVEDQGSDLGGLDGVGHFGLGYTVCNLFYTSPP